MLQFWGSKVSHPTWMGGTSRTLFTFFKDSGTYHSVALFVTFFAPGGEMRQFHLPLVLPQSGADHTLVVSLASSRPQLCWAWLTADVTTC